MIYTQREMRIVAEVVGRENKNKRKSMIIEGAMKQIIPSIMQAAVREAKKGLFSVDIYFYKRDVKRILKTLPKNNKSNYGEFCEFLEEWFKEQRYDTTLLNWFELSQESHICINWKKSNNNLF